MLADEVLQQHRVEVFATEEVVTGAGAHFHDPFEQLQNRHVERAATEVEDQERSFLVALVQSIGEGSGGWFVDQLLDLQPGQFAGDARGFALSVAEVGRDADHGFGDGFAIGAFNVFFQTLEHQRGQLFRAKRFVGQIRLRGAAHVALEQRRGQARMRVQTLARRLTDQNPALIIQADNARCQELTQGIGHQLGGIATPDGDQAVGGSQVNPYDHCNELPLRLKKMKHLWARRILPRERCGKAG